MDSNLEGPIIFSNLKFAPLLIVATIIIMIRRITYYFLVYCFDLLLLHFIEQKIIILKVGTYFI